MHAVIVVLPVVVKPFWANWRSPFPTSISPNATELRMTRMRWAPLLM